MIEMLPLGAEVLIGIDYKIEAIVIGVYSWKKYSISLCLVGRRK